MRFLLALAACACSPPKRPVSHTATTPFPPPLFAGLFVDGARFTYAVESSHEYVDDVQGTVEKTFTGSLTCTVSDVRDVPSAIAARLECVTDNGVPIVGDGPAGIFVATAAGLWRVAEFPRVAPASTTDQLFPWPPVERHVEKTDPTTPGWVTTITVAQHGTSWCHYLTYISAHDGDEEICVRDGIIIRGAASSSGGDSRTMSYTLVPS